MATVPNPRTWTVGELLTAAKMNTDVRDGLDFLLSEKPLCVLTKVVTQECSYGEAITWPVEAVDRDNGHSTVSNTDRYTSNTAGWYRISLNLEFIDAFDNGESRWILLTHNTSSNDFVDSVNVLCNTAVDGAGVNTNMSLTTVMYLGVGDYINVVVAFHPSVGTHSVGNNTRLAVEWIGV